MNIVSWFLLGVCTVSALEQFREHDCDILADLLATQDTDLTATRHCDGATQQHKPDLRNRS